MRSPRFFVLPVIVAILFAGIVLAPPLRAKDIEVKSGIVAVTVFPSGAQITRRAKIDLVKGDQTIVLRGLPERLIESSLRVEGEGEAEFEIGAVDSKRVLVDIIARDDVLDKSQRKKLEQEIERLADENSRLDERIRTLETQRQLMFRLAELPAQSASGPEGARGRAGAAVYAVEDWGRIYDLIGQRLDMASEQLLKYRQQQREKNRQIGKLKKRLAQQPARKERQMQVRVAISSPAAVKGGLKIKYQVREASWRPFYDARLSTGVKGARPQLRLTRRAGIRQWSGEDWKNVKIALSTTSPQKGAEAPVLHPERLDLRVEYPVSSAAPGYADKIAGVVGKKAASEMMEAAPAPRALRMAKPKMRVARERRARVRQYAFQAVFEIPGKIEVKSTGDEKKVAISSDKIAPRLKVKTVPRLNTTAYLYAGFTHDSKAVPLLPGAVALYRDGTFTGNGHLPLVNGGDKHELGFGADEAVKVTRAEIKRHKGKTGVFTSSKVDERRYLIRVTNRHQTPVDVEVIDRIPYSVNEKIVVRLLPTATRPDRRNIKDRRGILAWDFKLAAGEEKSIHLDYTITWPADRQLAR